MSAPKVEFGELPGHTAVRTEWQAVAAELKARVGQWGKVAHKETQSAAGGLATNIKAARLAAFRPVGHFEAVTRGTDVWARYVGGESV